MQHIELATRRKRGKPKQTRVKDRPTWKKRKHQVRTDAYAAIAEHPKVKAISVYLELTGQWPHFKKGCVPKPFTQWRLCPNNHVHTVLDTHDWYGCYTELPRDTKLASIIAAKSKLFPPRAIT
jgi:hypothetical protein